MNHGDVFKKRGGENFLPTRLDYSPLQSAGTVPRVPARHKLAGSRLANSPEQLSV